VDGPEFDARQVNFEVLMQRNAMYRGQECQSMKAFEEHREKELARLRASVARREKEAAELRAKLEAQGGTHHV
jgi:flagellar basal body rod protein FlgB